MIGRALHSNTIHSVETVPAKRRVTIRSIAIFIGSLAVLAIAVFGVIDRMRIESRLRANEEANARTETALAAAKEHSDIFDQNYQVSLQILETMKSMSGNMKDMTAAVSRKLDNAAEPAKPSPGRVIDRKLLKSPCTLWTESVSVDRFGNNLLIHRQLVRSKNDCGNKRTTKP